MSNANQDEQAASAPTPSNLAGQPTGSCRPYAYIAPTLRCLGSVRDVTAAKTIIATDVSNGSGRALPTSTREMKSEIHYLSGTERKDLAETVLSLKLASYDYKPEANEIEGRRLGFIIEDVPDALFVLKGLNRVDLYAFASGIAAVVQEQQKSIQDLQQEILELKAKARA